ncbi:unnamed protein product [Caenorhabditis nigoni]|uniref:Protein kinase domain-containing protein n=1 Tax=Caenorhabditis nigoni TaxID=1611254 RepID=A0A2G5SMN8_9PELO|nr:hypothetical protein B9Z55_022853 [Caenorhabditis nigoni]
MFQQTTTSNNGPLNDELLKNQLIARYKPGRFVSTTNLYDTGRYGIVIPVHDSRTNTGYLLKAQKILDLFKPEFEVFKSMREDSPFPHMVEHFGFFNPPNVFNYCIVMTVEGQSIQKLMARTPTCWSIGNCVRLIYQLIGAVQALHNLGFCHRDIHFGNVTIKRESDQRLAVKLIDFNGAVRLDPPQHPIHVMTTWQASLQVCEGMPYTRYDDLTSALFILLKVRNIDPFPFGNVDQLKESKKSFDANPNVWFKADTMWIAALYTQIQKQRISGVDYNALFQMLETAVPGINPQSDIDYQPTENNHIILL